MPQSSKRCYQIENRKVREAVNTEIKKHVCKLKFLFILNLLLTKFLEFKIVQQQIIE